MRDMERKENKFLISLEERGLKELVEKVEVGDIVIYRGFQKIRDNTCSIVILLDDSYTNTIAFIIGKIKAGEAKEKVLEIMNKFNRGYELGKFYINNGDELCGQISYIADAAAFDGDLFLDLLIHRLVLIKDEFFPEIRNLIEE